MPGWGTSNEYQQHIFVLKLEKFIPELSSSIPPTLIKGMTLEVKHTHKTINSWNVEFSRPEYYKLFSAHLGIIRDLLINFPKSWILPMDCYKHNWKSCSCVSEEEKTKNWQKYDWSADRFPTHGSYRLRGYVQRILSAGILTITTLWVNSANDKLMAIQENRLWHFMQIVSSWGSLQEMSKPVFWESKKKYCKTLSVEIFTQSAKH